MPVEFCPLMSRQRGALVPWQTTRSGRDMPRDWQISAIAATALNRGFTVLTQNLRHFTPLGVSAQDPFETLPSNILP